MRWLQTIGRCGNAYHVTLPRSAAMWLGWLPGEQIIGELTEDKRLMWRRAEPNEFTPKGVVLVKLDHSLPTQS